MKLNRIALLVAAMFCIGQSLLAYNPGGEVGGKDKSRSTKTAEQQMHKTVPAVSEAEIMAVMEADLVSDEATTNTPAKTAAKTTQKENGADSPEPAVKHSPSQQSKTKMSRAERKAMKKELKANLKEMRKRMKAQKKSPLAPDAGGDPLLYCILAFFIPPLAVGLWVGGLTGEFWLNLILTLLFWLPGFIHALIVILR